MLRTLASDRALLSASAIAQRGSDDGNEDAVGCSADWLAETDGGASPPALITVLDRTLEAMTVASVSVSMIVDSEKLSSELTQALFSSPVSLSGDSASLLVAADIVAEKYFDLTKTSDKILRASAYGFLLWSVLPPTQ
jgi:hypothetical protein